LYPDPHGPAAAARSDASRQQLLLTARPAAQPQQAVLRDATLDERIAPGLDEARRLTGRSGRGASDECSGRFAGDSGMSSLGVQTAPMVSLPLYGNAQASPWCGITVDTLPWPPRDAPRPRGRQKIDADGVLHRRIGAWPDRIDGRFTARTTEHRDAIAQRSRTPDPHRAVKSPPESKPSTDTETLHADTDRSATDRCEWRDERRGSSASIGGTSRAALHTTRIAETRNADT
jgi:hypothetical protein